MPHFLAPSLRLLRYFLETCLFFFQLNASISIRCVSQSSIVMNVSINGEVARFPVSPFADAPDQDVENLVRSM